MNIGIAGSNGYVGKNIISEFKKTKHTVVSLERNLNVDEISEVIKTNKIDCIINAVGIIKETKTNTFESAHVEYVNKLLEAGKKNNLKLFVQISALGVGENIQTEYYKSKEKAEEIIKSSGIPYTIIRPCMLFGKGDKSLSFFLKIMKTLHILPIFSGGKYLIQPLHIDDLTSLVTNVIGSSRYANRIIEIAGPKTYMYKEMIKAIKKSKKTKALLINIPTFLSKAIALIGNILPLPIDSDRLTMLTKGNYLKRRKTNSIIQITGTHRLEEI
ncbi:MAG: NAD(P)H-binding protein [bacterium]